MVIYCIIHINGFVQIMLPTIMINLFVSIDCRKLLFYYSKFNLLMTI